MLAKKHAKDDELTHNISTEGNVDYLSYNFNEMDLAASWRVLTKQKLNIINGIRLENASWRTWAQKRNNLKTVSPETLNWLKDSDVTWLYGPLHTVMRGHDNENFTKKTPVASTYGLISADQPPKESRPSPSPLQKPLKSALKKVTISDLLKRSASEIQIHQAVHENQDGNNNLSSSLSISKVNQQVGAFSASVIANHRQPKLRFNQYVEQCVALGSDKKEEFINDDEYTTDGSHEPDSYSDNQGWISEDGSSSSTDAVVRFRSARVRSSIRKIEPTLLKTSSRSEQDSSDSGSDCGPSYRRYSSYRKKPSTHWDTESAESDAFVKHIIEVSKNKEDYSQSPISHSAETQWQAEENEDTESISRQSDYNYEFDDDDWDTPPDSKRKFSSTGSIEDCHWGEEPEESKPPNQTNESILNNLVQWASNRLWPPDSSDTK
ncbi:hypothetical protein BY458DRAFT_561157 [Sporodiniella umbellata]|nr:hypothetical protein BY458DRAFT_561157 [Sporodiniella umbellata]